MNDNAENRNEQLIARPTLIFVYILYFASGVISAACDY